MARSLILTNDSFWGPIGNLTGLFQRVAASDADVIGLTDDLMYEPHLQSAFLVFREPVLQSAVFQQFWRNLKIWPRKRDLVKQCEGRSAGRPAQRRLLPGESLHQGRQRQHPAHRMAGADRSAGLSLPQSQPAARQPDPTADR